MRSTLMLCIAVLLVMSLSNSADAKPDGSLGADCASCHNNYEPPTPPPVDPPTPTDPPVDPPTDPPTPTDPPVDPPAEPGDDTPDEALDYIFGVEFSTIWDYETLGEDKELSYVFIAVVETDINVNLVEIETPSGQTLPIGKEEVTETENVRTEFYQDGDVFVWRYETRLLDKGQLKAFANGNYAIIAHHDEGTVRTKTKYENGKRKAKKPKHNKDKHEDDEHVDEEHDDN